MDQPPIPLHTVTSQFHVSTQKKIPNENFSNQPKKLVNRFGNNNFSHFHHQDWGIACCLQIYPFIHPSIRGLTGDPLEYFYISFKWNRHALIKFKFGMVQALKVKGWLKLFNTFFSSSVAYFVTPRLPKKNYFCSQIFCEFFFLHPKNIKYYI